MERTPSKKLAGASRYSIPVISRDVKNWYDKMPALRKEYKHLQDAVDNKFDSLIYPPAGKSADILDYRKQKAAFDRMSKKVRKAIK